MLTLTLPQCTKHKSQRSVAILFNPLGLESSPSDQTPILEKADLTVLEAKRTWGDTLESAKTHTYKVGGCIYPPGMLVPLASD
jgi:hypothetical protein